MSQSESIPGNQPESPLAPRRTADVTPAYQAAIVNSSHDAIVGLTLNGLIQSWNPAAGEIFGYTAERAIGRPFTLLIPEERRAEDEKILARVRAGERVPGFETVRLRSDGEPVHVFQTVSPIRTDSGEIVGVAAIASGIALTERTRLEGELNQVHENLRVHAHTLEATVAERTAHLHQTIAELEGVSYSLSHDLRGPLRTIQGFAQIVLADAAERLTPEEKLLLTKSINAANRLDRLIQDVLTYTRVSRQTVVLHPVEVERLVRQIIDERPEFQLPNAGVVVQGPIQLVHGHEASLTQVITNLLDNAVKFIPPDRQPRVLIRSETSGEKINLWFEDNGIGIPKEAQGRLFAIFQRVHDDKSYPGTGIGLAIVRKAVERMHGKVWLESEPGHGTRFCVQLPRGQSQ